MKGTPPTPGVNSFSFLQILKSSLLTFASIILIVGCSKQAEPTKDIWTAVGEGDIVTVRQLIESGGDVDAQEPEGGGTPLIVAAFLDQTEAAALLIDNGADLEIKNTDGSTALMVAAFFCHPDMVSLLLEKGADSSVKNNFGQTALDVASMEWSMQLEQVYQAIGAILQMEMDLDRIKATRPEIARILREHEQR